jgi:hypothetical protein
VANPGHIHDAPRRSTSILIRADHFAAIYRAELDPGHGGQSSSLRSEPSHRRRGYWPRLDAGSASRRTRPIPGLGRRTSILAPGGVRTRARAVLWQSQQRETRKFHTTNRPLITPERGRQPVTISASVVHGTVSDKDEFASPVILRCVCLRSLPSHKNMIRPIELGTTTIEGTLTDGIVNLCLTASDRPWGMVIFIKTG